MAKLRKTDAPGSSPHDKAGRARPEKSTVIKSIRINRDVEQIIARAAALTGDTFTHFIIEAAQAKATNAMIEQSYIVLQDSDFEKFTSDLENPWDLPESFKKLRKEGANRRAAADAATKAA